MGFRPDHVRSMQDRLEKAAQRASVKRAAPVAEPAQSGSPGSVEPFLQLNLGLFTVREFTAAVKPVGKPRMTRRDKFRQRPIVMRYREFADNLRAAVGELPPNPDIVLVTAFTTMPTSWSERKKVLYDGKPCRQKPDWDNIAKAVCDALFEDDSCIWLGLTAKYWCRAGQEKVQLKILYAKPD